MRKNFENLYIFNDIELVENKKKANSSTYILYIMYYIQVDLATFLLLSMNSVSLEIL